MDANRTARSARGKGTFLKRVESDCQPGDYPCYVALGPQTTTFPSLQVPNWAHNRSARRAMISGASLKRGDFLVEPLFHPSDYGRPNPSILDRRTNRALRFLARRAKLRRAECFCTCANPAAIWTVCTRIWCKPLGGTSGSCCAVR